MNGWINHIKKTELYKFLNLNALEYFFCGVNIVKKISNCYLQTLTKYLKFVNIFLYFIFYNFQDTVVALQSLASFEKTQSHGKTNLKVLVTANPLEHFFNINEKNKLLQQKVMLPEIPTKVILDLVGEGCSLIQVSNFFLITFFSVL